MRYRRNFYPGGSFFFTVVTRDRQPLFADRRALLVLGNAFRHVQGKRAFDMNAVVALPDHLHCIWTLPDGDADYPLRWRLIKSWFTKHYPHSMLVNGQSLNRKKNQPVFWQKKYWEHTIRDENDYLRHLDYIHFNPVKHGYVRSSLEWPFSSFHRYLKEGFYEEGWGRVGDRLGEEDWE